MKSIRSIVCLLCAVVVLACGGEVEGPGGAGSGAGGGGQPPDPEACNACSGSLTGANGPCAASVEACADDPVCAGWLPCSEACVASDFTEGCFSACGAAHADAADRIDAITTCVCGACSDPCAPGC
jgi:hypothetical protein